MTDKNILNNNSNESLNKLAILKDVNFNYIFNKTEKISTALYMITNFMSATEPLKWQIREVSLKMLDSVMTLNRVSMSNRDILMREITGYLFQVKSLFGIAYRSGFISTMNYQVVDSELQNLAIYIAEYDSNKLSMESELFGSEFWQKDSTIGSIGQGVSIVNNQTKGQEKGHQPHRHFNTTKTPDQIKGQSATRNSQLQNIRINTNAKSLISEISKLSINNNSNQNADRRSRIIKIIKDKKEVGVKDIALQITDCSEKTLQRELLAMVKDGILRKEGDRRWSRYFLA